MSGLWGWLQLLAVPLLLLGTILIVSWRQERRRRSTRRAATGLRKYRYGHGSLARRLGHPQDGSRRMPGTGPRQGPHDRPTYLD